MKRGLLILTTAVLACLGAAVPALAGSSLTIATDRPAYGENDAMSIYLGLAHLGPPLAVDLYIAVEVLGQYFFYPDFGQDPTPIRLDLEDGFELPPVAILNLPLPVYATTPYTVTWLAALLDPGTMTLVGDLGQSACTIYRGCAGPGQEMTGYLSVDTTWSPEEGPYLCGYGVTVDAGATLTILPGTVVKMDETRFTVQNGSHMICQGIALQPVTFTSIHDDSMAGDHDHESTAPAPADWLEITIDGQALLEHVRIAYGGGHNGCLAIYGR